MNPEHTPAEQKLPRIVKKSNPLDRTSAFKAMQSSVHSKSHILTTTSTVVVTLPTGEVTAPSPVSSTKSDATDRLIGFASAGGCILLIAAIGLLFGLKYTRTKHRRLIEDMERRLAGLEIQRGPPQTRRRYKKSSVASSTSLGSSWGAWRSKGAQSFEKIRTANKPAKIEDRKSLGHSWWSLSLQPTIEERQHVPCQPQNSISPSRFLPLSAIVEHPSQARPDSPTLLITRADSPTIKMSECNLTITQPCLGESQEGKETRGVSEKRWAS